MSEKTCSAAGLFKDYDKNAQWRRSLYLGIPALAADIDQALQDMRDSYEALIPDIPYIGTRNFHLKWAIPNAKKIC